MGSPTTHLGHHHRRPSVWTIDWLNDNSAAVQAVATTVLVLVTMVYVVATWRLVRSAEEDRRPFISVRLHVGGDLRTTIIVENVGRRPATDISFEILEVPDVGDTDDFFDAAPPIRNGISFLVPGSAIQLEIPMSGPRREMPPGRIRMTVRYRLGKRRYESDALIDFADYDGAELTGFRTDTAEIAHQVERLGKVVSRRSQRPGR